MLSTANNQRHSSAVARATHRLMALVRCFSSLTLTVQNGSCLPKRDLLGRFRCFQPEFASSSHCFANYHDQRAQLFEIRRVGHGAESSSGVVLLAYADEDNEASRHSRCVCTDRTIINVGLPCTQKCRILNRLEVSRTPPVSADLSEPVRAVARV